MPEPVKSGSVLIGGHRGSGTTDSGPARPDLPAESTLESIVQAFNDGAGFVEIDAQQTADDQMVVTHADNLAHHVFGDARFNSIGETNLADLRTVRFGRDRKGPLATLAETFNAIAATDAFSRPGFRVILEIKNIREIEKDKFRPGPDSYYDALLRSVDESGFPLDKIVFASFAARDLISLKERCPEAKTGFLFWETDSGEDEDIYPGQGVAHAAYQCFNEANLDAVRKLVDIDYVHPEPKALTPNLVAKAAEAGLGINTWIWKEQPPDEDPETVRRILDLAERHHADITILTNYVPEMRKIIDGLRPRI